MSAAFDYSRLFRLDGRVAFVSGAAGHLGSAVTRALAAQGATVIANGRDDARLAAFAATLRDEGHAIRTACFDMMDGEAVKRFFGGLERLDVLVNNAITVRMGTIASSEREDFETAYRSGVVAAFEAMRAAETALDRAVAAQGHAGVVNVSSMYGGVSPDPRLYGNTGFNSPPAYGPAKAALEQLTRHMACHWGHKGIRVNAVSPGPFPNPRIQAEHGDFVRRLSERTALGRVGFPQELAGAVVYLASDAARFTTGADIAVDGGWTAW